ncbi:MAG TPA: undecaprenyl-diphosphate phosphatase [Candidatus Saccharimonadia bacterium]|jgi:undecaprenyl-diphosphatase
MLELTYIQAITIGLLQGVTELFPISSLGHSVLVPAWLGGSWSQLVTQQSTSTSETSPFLAFVVALHVATAIALLIFYRNTWVRIIRAFFRTLSKRRATDSDERLAWLLIIGTIPVGIFGLLLEHPFRVLFAKPLAAAIFLTLNGIVLLIGERLRRRSTSGHTTRKLTTLAYTEAGAIGFFQTFALLAGISRSGITIVGGLVRGLNHEDAANFAFLLATPVILAAGVLKLPELLSATGRSILGQALVGAIAAGIAAYVSVRFLTKYFETKTLTPFAIYCLIAGALSILRFAL